MADAPQHIFRFKQFAMSNTLSAMKIGTDGVLLGAWACISPEVESPRVLDVGCGTGVVGLMIAQRYPDASVTCIDISEKAVAECAGNIATSPFAGRMTVSHDDFLLFNTASHYDLIVSNPPYFKDSLQSPGAERTLARHDDSMPLPEMMKKATELLPANGRVALVLPVEREDDVIFAASVAGLQPVRRCDVLTVERKPPRRTLWEFSPSPASQCQCNRLIIHDQSGDYSKEYVSLLKDFYLAF